MQTWVCGYMTLCVYDSVCQLDSYSTGEIVCLAYVE